MPFSFGGQTTEDASSSSSIQQQQTGAGAGAGATGGGFTFGGFGGGATTLGTGGAAASAVPAAASTASTAPASTGFTFGGGHAAAASTASTAPASTGFTFGGGQAAAAAGNHSHSSGSGFAFGGPNTATTSTTTGNSTTTTPALSSTTGFSFGSQPSTVGIGVGVEGQAGSATASDANTATKPSFPSTFSFGGGPSAATATATPSSFSFGGEKSVSNNENPASTVAATAPVTFGSPPPAPQTNDVTTPQPPSLFMANNAVPATPAPVTTPLNTSTIIPTTTNTNTNTSTDTTGASSKEEEKEKEKAGDTKMPPQPSQQESQRPPPPLLPLDYSHMTVEQILNTFQAYLEADAAAFVQEADRVVTYDARLRTAQADLQQLTQAAQTALIQQQNLHQHIASIESQQNVLDQQLNDVEKLLDHLMMVSNTSTMTTTHDESASPAFVAGSLSSSCDADIQRESAYTMAVHMEQRLNGLVRSLEESLQLLDTTTTTTTTTTTADDDDHLHPNHDQASSSSSSSLLTTLNQHQNALAELEQTAHRMERDMQRVSAALSS